MLHWDQLGVVVTGGVFNVILGSIEPLTPDVFSGPSFLGIEINGNEELEPRQEIVSSAFALRCAEALNAQLLGGLGAVLLLAFAVGMSGDAIPSV